jgi:folate-binding Fe-S cluster repair protein YgfZ
MKIKFVFKRISEQMQRDKDIMTFKKYNALFNLKTRAVVSVTGEDANTFLQSMITNDMRQLNDDKVSISTLFLNPKGRILYESQIIKSNL